VISPDLTTTSTRFIRATLDCSEPDLFLLPNTFRLEFFSALACDESGRGEGASFVCARKVSPFHLKKRTLGLWGWVTAILSPSSSTCYWRATCVVNVPRSAGNIITATATRLRPLITRPWGANFTDTSEFSNCLDLTVPEGLNPPGPGTPPLDIDVGPPREPGPPTPGPVPNAN